MEKNAQLTKLKGKIPRDADKFISTEEYENVLSNLLEDSKNIALSTLYPFLDDFEGVELPKKYYNWQIRASVELYKWLGNAGVKSYSETGLSWSRDNDGPLSNSLLEELEPPHVGIPRRRDNIDNQ